jgi:hypothetical protein
VGAGDIGTVSVGAVDDEDSDAAVADHHRLSDPHHAV